jgi:hypothetical protein
VTTGGNVREAGLCLNKTGGRKEQSTKIKK